MVMGASSCAEREPQPRWINIQQRLIGDNGCRESRFLASLEMTTNISTRGSVTAALSGFFRGELHQVSRDAGCVVTRHRALVQIVTQYGNYSHAFDRVEIVDNLACSFQGVFCFHFVGSWRAVDQRVVEELFLRVL